MTIDELIHLAAKGYPDEYLLEFWNDYKHEPRYDHTGYGLAKFIVIELFETFDIKGSDEEQLNTALEMMSNAVEHTMGVVGEIENALTKGENADEME
jgi:hypothetical protein